MTPLEVDADGQHLTRTGVGAIYSRLMQPYDLAGALSRLVPASAGEG